MKDNILNNDLKNLFNVYNKYLDFRAASLKNQPKDSRKNGKTKPGYIKYKMENGIAVKKKKNINPVKYNNLGAIGNSENHIIYTAGRA